MERRGSNEKMEGREWSSVGMEVSFTVPSGREEWKGGRKGRMLIRKEMKLIVT